VEHEAAALARTPGRSGAAARPGDLRALGGNAAVTALLAPAPPVSVQRSGCSGGACGCGACGGGAEHDEAPVQRYAMNPGSLLALQRMAGNASVGELMLRAREAGSA